MSTFFKTRARFLRMNQKRGLLPDISVRISTAEG